jgi:hypothetical protein
MNSILSGFLLLLSFMSSVFAQTDCQACQSVAESEKTLCMTDGKLHSSLFCARCLHQDNYEMFSCPMANLSGEACRSECVRQIELYRCRANCVPSGNRNLIICGSNGQPYSNYCQAKCVDPTITPMFDCSVYKFPLSSCHAKCGKFVSCRKSTIPSKLQLLCGVDALVYSSLEELKCNDVQQVEDASGRPKFDVADCMGFVQLRYGGPVGVVKERPPIYFPSGLSGN